ncbi:hypothetical protein [uncultured Clostridium sp.]|uniref:hypothetical protein n=1 Tax=uncultured Clostridium sp. TaxID=59620 RepID=UPI0026153BB8|nr:hypothetical protein [uncultured Clostridium sp.]
MLDMQFNKKELQEIEKHLFLSIQADKLFETDDKVGLGLAEKLHRKLEKGILGVDMYNTLALFVDVYIYKICREQTDNDLLRIGFSKANVRMIRRIAKFSDDFKGNING